MDSEERRFKMLDFLLDYSKGTLWWVDNDLWKDVISGFVMKKGNKKHPGLSIARKRAEGLFSTVPMLIGTSRPAYGSRVLAVRHMNPEGSEHHDAPGFFSPLRPFRIRFDEFGRADRITQNSVKPRLERDEMRRLDEILSGKGA